MLFWLCLCLTYYHCIATAALVALSPVSTSSILNSSPSKPIPKILGLRWLSNGAREGLASALATSVVKAILQPLDTIKTVQQGRSLGPWTACREILSSRGVGGLWSGLGVTLIGSAPASAVYFGSYSSIKRRLLILMPPRLKLLTFALSASAANTLAAVVRVPLEVVKQRMQMGQFETATAAILHCWKHEGPVGLFGGGRLASQIMRDVPYAVATLVTYEILHATVRRYQLQLRETETTEGGNKKKKVSSSLQISNAFCGSLAGGFGSFVTNPMDVVKTRMMTSERYATVGLAVQRIYREEGISAFMIGVSSRLMHKVPANGLFFLCYEWFRFLLDVDLKDRES